MLFKGAPFVKAVTYMYIFNELFQKQTSLGQKGVTESGKPKKTKTGETKEGGRINVTINMTSTADYQAKKAKIDEVNEKVVDTHKCVVANCGKEVKNRKTLLLHYYQVHSEEKFYTCSTCHMSFRRSDSLEKHAAKFHPDKPLPKNVCIMSKLAGLEKKLIKQHSPSKATKKKTASATSSSESEQSRRPNLASSVWNSLSSSISDFL